MKNLPTFDYCGKKAYVTQLDLERNTMSFVVPEGMTYQWGKGKKRTRSMEISNTPVNIKKVILEINQTLEGGDYGDQ
ncbi:MAG: hypothetical protein R3333_14355 [Lishizhenia sp.]|nr:hypothetical protein [Lishizhenia sp.]